ncbi:nitrogen fixation protein NifQ [Caldichromatium japonicum]|uniref:Nitrogen fixation protein NifQ n=1 Tax=Caldichromatium japonicum TaxID=2699430 RepID=A0A6G7VFJ6_9GAMM|nr:nitrogen fixation protein NifQ [Caldichromatium japonicum]QIK38567.1 nitrogen fixation protein NifQ [Caldichromatium japonicum]
MKPLRECRESLVGELLRRPAGADFLEDPLRSLLASMLAGRALGEGIMSATLGLPAADFAKLWDAYFPGPHLRLEDGRTEDIPEMSDLIQLFTDYRAESDERYAWMARIVAWGCAGRNHLWQDMGFADRRELSAFMNAAFPALAALNTGDMKWKKFIYRHYCQRDGIYVCPAPSCGECADYAKCFAPEE